MNLFKLTSAILLAGASIMPAQAAHFVFHYDAALDQSQTGSPITATLYLNTADTLNALGGYDILSATGTVNGTAILGIKANPNQPNNNADGLFIYDNVLYTSGPVLDPPGLVVNTAGLEINFGYDGNDVGGYYAISTDGSTFVNSHGQTVHNYRSSEGAASIASVPEPASWAMLVGGFALTGMAMRKRGATISFG